MLYVCVLQKPWFCEYGFTHDYALRKLAEVGSCCCDCAQGGCLQDTVGSSEYLMMESIQDLLLAQSLYRLTCYWLLCNAMQIYNDKLDWLFEALEKGLEKGKNGYEVITCSQ